MNFGYARVSTADQNPNHQIDALLRAGVDRTSIHLDTASLHIALRESRCSAAGEPVRRWRVSRYSVAG